MSMRSCPQCGRNFVEGEAFCPFDGTRLPPVQANAEEPLDPLIGSVLNGRYRLDRVLGQGGMGTVYAGVMLALNKPVAVKVLRAVQDDGGQAHARFEREARAAGSLGEEHIVDVQDFGQTEDGSAFLVMELLAGRDLATLLEGAGRLPLERAVPIALQCCQALGAAHAAGIVHRDLKPENIFLITRGNTRDFVKLVDFGLAKMSETETTGAPGRKLTKTGMIFGTPQYMSPEQCMGRATDHRADIYALGIIVYEMLCGRVPFDGETFMGVLNQHMMDPPPPMEHLVPGAVAPAVERVILKALQKKAGQRFDSTQEFADALLQALRESGHGALADTAQGLVQVAQPESFMALTKRKDSGVKTRSGRTPAPAQPTVPEHIGSPPVPDRRPEAMGRPWRDPETMDPGQTIDQFEATLPMSREEYERASQGKPPPQVSPSVPPATLSPGAFGHGNGNNGQSGHRGQEKLAVPSGEYELPQRSGSRVALWVFGMLLLLAVGGGLGYGVLHLLR